MKEQKQDAIKQLKVLLNPIEQRYIPEILDEIFNPESTKESLNVVSTVISFIKREEVTNINLCFKNNKVKYIIGKLKHVDNRTEAEEYKRRYSKSIRYSTRIEGGKQILHDFTFKIAI